MDTHELKKFIIDIIEEEFSPNPVEMAPRWSEGVIILKPANDTQPKEIPLDVFFKKVTGIRESLRVLEQKLNNHPALTAEDKSTFQSYITKCYGSLTTFNILFRHDKDKFVGAAGSGGSPSSKDPNLKNLSVRQAQQKLGMNEYGDE